MSKQKPVEKIKEPAVIADRIAIMAPEASVKAGLQFFTDKLAAEDQARRDGYQPLSILEAKEVIDLLAAVKKELHISLNRPAIDKLLAKYGR